MNILKMTIALTILILSTSANSALVGRLAATPGGTDYQAYYDDQLDITWMANATIDYFLWDGVVTSIAALDINGVTGWRLPSMDVNGDGTVVYCQSATQTECKDNEYSHLYNYGAGTSLGNGITPSNSGPFTNVNQWGHWSNTDYVNDTSLAWAFSFQNGVTSGTFDKNQNYFAAWAVHTGDVSAVPVPAAVWLFGSGLIGLIGIARHKKS